MIPKIIHYCWFGKGEKPKSVQRFINQWKRILPDYRIVEWNEDNFDVGFNDFTREAYEHKKYAFVSDVARLYALVSMGGIYLDTDVEVLRPFDDLLDRDFFLGREYSGVIGTATIGASKGNEIVQSFLDTYQERHFEQPDGSIDTVPNVVHLTNHIQKCFPAQEVFDRFYFSPKHPATRVCEKKKHTYCIHHFDGTWTSDEFRRKRKKEGRRIFLHDLKVKIVSFFIDYEKARKIKKQILGRL